MQKVWVDVQNEVEKKVLLAFLDSLGYEYSIESDDHHLNSEQVSGLVKRKQGFLEGNSNSRPWSEIKKEYTK